MMKRCNIVLIMAGFFLLASIGAVSPVYASSCNQENDQATGGHTMFGRPFSDMDMDGDDSLSFKEFTHVFTSTEQQSFDRLDSDKNGSLSREEWHEFKAAHGLKHMD
jgi:hypothetical protein